jgi:hypothetical protein
MHLADAQDVVVPFLPVAPAVETEFGGAVPYRADQFAGGGADTCLFPQFPEGCLRCPSPSSSPPPMVTRYRLLGSAGSKPCRSRTRSDGSITSTRACRSRKFTRNSHAIRTARGGLSPMMAQENRRPDR